MRLLKNLLVCFLIILTLNLYLSNTAISQQLYAKANAPKHDPQSWSTPEVKFPTVKVKKSNWFWWVLGLSVVAGGAAALASTPEEDPSGGNGSSSGGLVGITW